MCRVKQCQFSPSRSLLRQADVSGLRRLNPSARLAFAKRGSLPVTVRKNLTPKCRVFWAHMAQLPQPTTHHSEHVISADQNICAGATVRANVRLFPRSRSDFRSTSAKRTGVQPMLWLAPAFVKRIPTLLQRAIRRREVWSEWRCLSPHSPRISLARTPGVSTGWWCNGSPHGDARSSHARRRARCT